MRCPPANSMRKHIINELGYDQNIYMFALILGIKIVLCSKFHGTKFVSYECFHITFRANPTCTIPVRTGRVSNPPVPHMAAEVQF